MLMPINTQILAIANSGLKDGVNNSILLKYTFYGSFMLFSAFSPKFFPIQVFLSIHQLSAPLLAPDSGLRVGEAHLRPAAPGILRPDSHSLSHLDFGSHSLWFSDCWAPDS